MMHKRDGFSLIELIIGMAIASVLSLFLADSLFQANRSRIVIDESIYVYSHAAILFNQLERDITTSFAPTIQYVPAENPQTNTIQTQNEQQKNTQNNPASSENKETENKDKKLKKIFYGTSAGDNVDMLTFITTSPLATYWGAKTGNPKARIARVIYRLTKDTSKPDTYILSRQEGQNLDFDSYSPDQGGDSRTYTIVKDIKKCTITYKVGVEKELPEKTEKQSSDRVSSENKTPEKPEIEYLAFTEWKQEDTAEQNEKEEKKPFPRLPHMVIFELTLWDHEHKKESDFKMVYAIAWRDTLKKKTPPKSVVKKPVTSSHNTPSNSNT